MGKITLVTGGARSGKSSFAESLCRHRAKVGYIATARVQDHEMADRIEKHKKRRPPSWETFEVYTDLAEYLPSITQGVDVLVLDCITIYTVNRMLEGVIDYSSCPVDQISAVEQSVLDEFSRVLSIAKAGRADLIVVTNEIGMGIVPENRLARVYRDIIGRVNQLCASFAEDVFLVVNGIPLQIKGGVQGRSHFSARKTP